MSPSFLPFLILTFTFYPQLQHAHSEYGITAVVLMFSSVNSDQGAAVRNVLGEALEVKRMLTEQAAMFKDIMNQVQAFVGYVPNHRHSFFN